MSEKKWYRRYIPKGSIYLKGRVWWCELPLGKGKRKQLSLRTIKKTVAGYAAQRAYEETFGNKPTDLQRDIDDILQEFKNHDKKRIVEQYSIERQVTIKRFVDYIGLDIRMVITPELVNQYLDSRGGEIGLTCPCFWVQ